MYDVITIRYDSSLNIIDVECITENNFFTEDFDIDEIELMQCTGVPDKNGMIAWEGDVIMSHYSNAAKADHVETIIFKDGRYCAEHQSGMGQSWALLPVDGAKRLSIDKTIYMESFEIIGTIHE